MNDIHDIKGFVPVPHQWLWLVWLSLGLGLVFGLIWWWKRRRPATDAGLTLVLPSPLEIVLAALRQLRQDNPPVEEYYTRLSNIVRQYLENQLQLRAPERTTEEFLYELAQGNRLSDDHKNLLAAFLQEADLVKFARHRPGVEDKARAFGAAEKFVQETTGGASLPASRDGAQSTRPEPHPPSPDVAAG